MWKSIPNKTKQNKQTHKDLEKITNLILLNPEHLILWKYRVTANIRPYIKMLHFLADLLHSEQNRRKASYAGSAKQSQRALKKSCDWDQLWQREGSKTATSQCWQEEGPAGHSVSASPTFGLKIHPSLASSSSARLSECLTTELVLLWFSTLNKTNDFLTEKENSICKKQKL